MNEPAQPTMAPKKVRCANPNCGIIFEVPFGRWNMRYHNDDCRIIGKRMHQSKYYRSNQPKLLEKARSYYLRNRKPKTPEELEREKILKFRRLSKKGYRKRRKKNLAEMKLYKQRVKDRPLEYRPKVKRHTDI